MDVASTGPQATVGVRELKNRLSAYLDRVKAGEEITVTEHGRPIARLRAVGAEDDQLARLVAEGVVRPATAPRRLPSRRVHLGDGDAGVRALLSEQRR